MYIQVSKRRSPRNKLNANPPALPDPLAEFIGPAPREESGTDGSDGYQQDSDDEPDAEPMDVEDDSEVEDELVKAAKQARRPSSSKVKAGNSKQAPSSKPLRKKRAKAADEDKENLPKAKKLKVDKGKGKAAVPPSDSTPGNVESTLGPPGFIPVPPLQPGPSAAALVASTSLPFVFTVLPATTAQPAEPGAKTLASKTNAKAVREANKTKLDSRKRITDHAARKLLEGSKTVIENAISMQAKADGTLLCYGIAFEGERAQTAKSIEKASLGVAEAVDKLSNLLDKLRLPGEVSATKLSLSSAIADKIVDKISADIATIAGLVVSAQTATVVPDSEDDLAGTSS